MICGTVNRDHVEKEFLELLRRQVMDEDYYGGSHFRC